MDALRPTVAMLLGILLHAALFLIPDACASRHSGRYVLAAESPSGRIRSYTLKLNEVALGNDDCQGTLFLYTFVSGFSLLPE